MLKSKALHIARLVQQNMVYLVFIQNSYLVIWLLIVFVSFSYANQFIPHPYITFINNAILECFSAFIYLYGFTICLCIYREIILSTPNAHTFTRNIELLKWCALYQRTAQPLLVALARTTITIYKIIHTHAKKKGKCFYILD